MTETPLLLDTLSVIESSIHLFLEDSLVNDHMHVSMRNDSLHITAKEGSPAENIDSLDIHYRVFPVRFTTPYAHLDSNKVLPKAEELYIGYDFDIYKAKGLRSTIL